MFGKKKPEVNAEGREYGHRHETGPFNDADMKRAYQLVEEIGSAKERGFIIIVKRKTLEKDENHESAEIDGMVKVSSVNKKFMLDTIFHALGMDNKAIIEYATMRTVMGSDFDEATHSHDD